MRALMGRLIEEGGGGGGGVTMKNDTIALYVSDTPQMTV